MKNYCCVCGRPANGIKSFFYLTNKNDVYCYCDRHGWLGRLVYKRINKNLKKEQN